jgi:hypothetical protein
VRACSPGGRWAKTAAAMSWWAMASGSGAGSAAPPAEGRGPHMAAWGRVGGAWRAAGSGRRVGVPR